MLTFLLGMTLTGFAQKKKVVLNERFENNSNGWEHEDEETELSLVQDDHYLLQVKDEESHYFLIPVPLDTKQDFIIETTFTVLEPVSGGKAPGIFALIFGADYQEPSYYLFGFYPETGRHFVYEIVSEVSPSFKESTSPQAYTLPPGMAKNKLIIRKKGDKFEFLANGENLLISAGNLPFHGNEMGFYIKGRNLKIAVESLTVTQLHP